MGKAQVVVIGHPPTLARRDRVAGDRHGVRLTASSQPPGGDRALGRRYGRSQPTGIRHPLEHIVFDTVLGLPVHALVVHGVVVLLPLLTLVTVWWAWRPPAGRDVGWLVVAADLAVTVLTWVAQRSGEALQARLGGQVARDHAQIAKWLPWLALALAASAVLVQVARGPGRTAGMPGRVTAAQATRAAAALRTRVTGALATVVAVGALVWTVRTGHSGTEAVWGGIVGSTGK
jgi:hypothetical protein